MFVDYCLAQNYRETCILIDDVVPTRMVVDYNSKLAVVTVNLVDVVDFCNQDFLYKIANS